MKSRKVFTGFLRGISMRSESRLVILLAAASLIGALVITAVYNANSFPDGSEKSRPRIVVIIKSIDPSLAFWQTVGDGIRSACKDFDVDFTIVGPASEMQVVEQIQIIRDTIRSKPDAIVLAAADYDRLAPVAKEIKAAHIPLVSIDSFIKGDDADTKIGTDNYSAGQQAGAALLEHLPPGSPVMIMSYVQGTSSAIDRESGVRDALRGKAEIVGTIYSSGEQSIAYMQALNLLDTNPGVKGIVALNDPTTIGAARALKDSGRAKEVVLVGFDNSLAVLGFVEADVIRDTIVQRPFNMGYLGIKAAVDLIRGRKVEPFIDTGSQVINHENMLLPENQKLLFPVAR
jgi:ribose transport system substrate-binding protein